MIYPVLLGLVVGAMAAPGELSVVQIRRERDSVWVDLDFRDGRPSRFRVMQAEDSLRKPQLQIEFQNASESPVAGSDLPDWLKVRVEANEALSVYIQLAQAVPWKSQWQDRVLQISFPDKVRSNSVLKNPWLVGGVSAALAGGAAVWLLSGSAPTPPVEDDVIPPPDIVLPK